MQSENSLPLRSDRNGLQQIFALGVWLLGVLVLARTAIVVSAIRQFGEQIAHLPFRWIASHSLQIAWVWSALICAFGLVCLFRIRIRLTLLILVVLLIAVSGVTYFADRCDCSDGLRPRFFEWAQHITPVLAGCAGALLFLGRRTSLPAGRAIKRTLVGLITSTALFVIAFFASGSGSARMTALPSSGTQLRIYLSATCPHCLKSAPRVRALANDPTLSDVVVFIGANSQSEIDSYFAQAKLEFEYNGLTLSQLREVTPAVPATELVAGGKVIAKWHDVIPSSHEVQSELSKAGYSLAQNQ
jgi:hypothetical protein